MKGKICFFLLVLLTVYLNIMYTWPFGTVALGWELFLCICCIALSVYFNRTLQITMLSSKTRVVQKGEAMQVEIGLLNKGVLPVSKVFMQLECRYLSGNQTKDMKIQAMVDAGENSTVICTIVPEYSGKLLLHMKHIKIMDYLGISSRTRRVNMSSQVLVMPRLYDVAVRISNQTRMFSADSDRYDQVQKGDDPSEVFDVRVYRPGDAPQRIHWKLSAKEEELYVKEYSLPVGAAVVCLVENAGGRKKLSQIDEVIEAVLSFSQELLSQKCMHYIAWKQQDREEMTRVLVQQEADYEVLLGQMLSWNMETLEADTERLYKETYLRDVYHTVICFGSMQNSMRICKNGIPEYEWETGAVKAGMQKAYLNI